MFVTKATVQSVSGDMCSVSIPLLSGQSNSNFQASICSDPGVKPNLKKGDLVIVAFEDNDYGKPMVIGRLFNNSSKALASGDFKNLIVTDDTKLSTSTTIGEVTYDNLKGLKGYTGTLTTDLADLKKKVDSNNPSSIDGLKKLVLSSDIYGDSAKMEKIKSPVAGQVFFLIGGAD